MATQLTDLLVSTAEFSNLLSFLAVLGGLLVMCGFIVRLIYQDLGDGAGGVTRVTRSPQTAMDRVAVPMMLGLAERPAREGGLALRVSSQVPYRLRYCWGVQVAAFHHVLRAPWPWLQEAFHRGNLFGAGCVEHGQASPVLQPHEELELVARRTGPGPLDLGPAPRGAYPLVVVALRADLGEGDLGMGTAVTGLLIVIHIRDTVCPIPTQVLGTYLRRGPQGATSLLPLYVTEREAESDGESAGEETEVAEGPRGARCVVCQLARVTRAALPCRHATTCGSCFERLKSQCPMCRAFINSYFLLGPEPLRPDSPAAPSRAPPRGLWARAQGWWADLELWVNRGLGPDL